jgi:hypothetical protein
MNVREKRLLIASIVFIVNIPLGFWLALRGHDASAVVVITSGTILIWLIALEIL